MGSSAERTNRFGGRSWFAGVVLVLGALAGFGYWVSTQAPVPLPHRLVRAAEAVANDRLSGSGLRLSIGAIQADLRNLANPTITADQIAIAAPDGAELARAASGQLALGIGWLSSGLIEPRAIRLEGVQLALNRAADGSFSVAFGSGRAAMSLDTPGELISQLRGFFDEGAFAGLRELGIVQLGVELTDDLTGHRLAATGGDISLRRTGEKLEIDADLGQVTGNVEGNEGSVRGVLVSDRPGGNAEARLTVRGLVPAGFDALAGRSPLGDLLDRIEAPVALDLGASLSDNELGELTGALTVGEGHLDLPGMTEPVPLESLAGRVSLSGDGTRLSIADLKLGSPALSFSGRAEFFPDSGGDGIVAQIVMDDLAFDGAGFLEAPVRFDLVSADARFSRTSERLDVGEIRLSRGDEVVRLSGYSELGVAMADRTGDLSLDIAADKASPETAFALWPTRFAGGLRNWLKAHVEEGKVSDFTLAIRKPSGEEPTLGLSFQYSDAQVRPVAGLPSVIGGQGRATLADDNFILVADGAAMRLPDDHIIRMTNGILRRDNIHEKGRPVEIAFDAATSAGGVLTLLKEPLFAKEQSPPQSDGATLSADDAIGQVAARVSLTVPTGPGATPGDVDFKVSGDLTGFENTGLVGDRRLASERLAIEVTPAMVRLAGPARIEGVPFDVTYSRPIGPDASPPGKATIDAKVPISAKSVQLFGVPFTEQEIGGSGTGRLTVGLAPGKAPSLDLAADLTGARLSIPELSWSKPQGREARLRLTGRLGPEAGFDRLSFSGPGLTLNGDIAMKDAGQSVSLIRLSELKVGNWLDAKVEIRPAPGGGAPKVSVIGGTFDMRNYPAGSGGGSGGSGASVDVALDRVALSRSIALTNVKGALKGQGGDFTARVNGGAPVSVALQPARQGTGAVVTASDAGAVFASTGIFRMAQGGSMDLRLNPVGAGQYQGQLRVANTTLRNTPAFAELVSSLSIVGAVQQAAGEGIPFSDVRADFRLSGNSLVLDSGSAVGPSLGVSLDGTVDLAAGIVDLQGVISPVYWANQIGSFMTRRGEGLLGVTYRITGPASQPRISANPLSLLAPGVFREIFRRPPPAQR